MTQTIPGAPVTDARLKSWSDECWNAALSRYADFLRQHDRRPRRHQADAAERGIGGWLNRQQTAHRRGLLDDHRAEALDRVDPDWNLGQAETTRAITARVRVHVEQHGAWPRRWGPTQDERVLGDWVARRLAPSGGSRSVRSSVLEELKFIARDHGLAAEPPRMSADERDFPIRRQNRLRRAATYAAFVVEHQHAPNRRKGADAIQRGLAFWAANIRRDLIGGVLKPADIQVLRDAGLVDSRGRWVEIEAPAGCPAGRCLR